MFPSIRGVLLCALTLAGAGCFETRQIVTLNPDGSGKVVVDTLLAAQGMMMMAATSRDAASDPNGIARRMAAMMVSHSKGIDAWSDVSCEIARDGRVHIAGTAWFPDYSRIKLEGPDGLDANWTKVNGGIVLEIATGSRDQAATAPARTLTDAEANDLLRRRRQEWQLSKAMMGQVFDSLKIDTTFILPGKVAEANIFEKTDQGVRLVIEGRKILAAMDKMMSDDKFMLDSLKAGRDPSKEGPGACASDGMSEMIFGQKGPIRAKVTGDIKPLFDYKAEMEKARAAQPAMMKTLRIEPLPAGK